MNRNRFRQERKVVLFCNCSDRLRHIAGAENEMRSQAIVLLNGLAKERDSIQNWHVNIRNDRTEEPLSNGLERHLTILRGCDLPVPAERSLSVSELLRRPRLRVDGSPISLEAIVSDQPG